IFQQYGRVPGWMRNWIIEPGVASASRWTNLRLFNLAANYVRRSNVPAPDRYFSYSLISSVPGYELFTTDFLASINGNDPLTTARDHFFAAPARKDLNRWLYLDLKI